MEQFNQEQLGRESESSVESTPKLQDLVKEYEEALRKILPIMLRKKATHSAFSAVYDHTEKTGNVPSTTQIDALETDLLEAGLPKEELLKIQKKMADEVNAKILH